MNTFIFYLAAVTLCAMSTVLIRNATAYSMASHVNAEVRTRCLVIGRVFIAIAAVSAGVGAFAQYTTLLHR